MTSRAAIADLSTRKGQSIIGQVDVIDRLIIDLLANGNLLIEGLPGLAKTRAVKAMEERQVTVADTTHKMERLFIVMATRNPIEQEGTYPLPEAQMDRLMMAHTDDTSHDPRIHVDGAQLRRLGPASRALSFLPRQPARSVLNGRHASQLRGRGLNFEKIFGTLYHLNAKDKPENEDYPSDPEFREKFGPLTIAAAIDFIKRKKAEGVPWFVWWSGTRMHFRTPVKSEMRAKATELAGRKGDEYSAGMIEYDLKIGQFLDVLDELGIADNTIVQYSTDYGPHMNTWPGKIEAGSVSDEIMHHMDWLPTLLAAAGNPTSRNSCW